MRGLVATRSRSPSATSKGGRRSTAIALWLPLTPLLLLLAPLALLLAAFASLHPRARAAGLLGLVWATGALLASLSGSRIEIDAPPVRVRLGIL